MRFAIPVLVAGILFAAVRLHAGDNFSQATTLTGLTDSNTQSNETATVEAGEPNFGGTVFRSLWWKWTAPANGRVTFDTVGSQEMFGSSSFAKNLRVYIAKNDSPTVSTLATVYSNGATKLPTLIDFPELPTTSRWHPMIRVNTA
jgi:hypothetical protein